MVSISRFRHFFLPFFVQYICQNWKIIKNIGQFLRWFLANFVPKKVKNYIIQKASISVYSCHKCSYSKELVWKSFLDIVLQSRSLCDVDFFWLSNVLGNSFGNLLMCRSSRVVKGIKLPWIEPTWTNFKLAKMNSLWFENMSDTKSLYEMH